jgi:glycosyltransferase involved in cell wall biosynthesis
MTLPARCDIVHVIDSVANAAAGPSYSVPALCRELANEGNSVTLVSIGEAGHVSDKGYFDRRLRQDYGSVPLLRRLRFSRALQSELRILGERKDVIFHVHGLWLMANIYPATIARRAGRPLVLAPRGMLAAAAINFSKWRKRLMWYAVQARALEAVSCFHATSEQEYREIRDFGLRQPVAIVPNGIAVPETSFAAPERGGTRTALYLGRIHPKKGLDRLITAWKEVEHQRPDWSLRIVGPDEVGYMEQLRRQALELGLYRVSFEKPLFGAAKDEAFRAADLFVFPTLNENFGMTVAEALAQGTPVICTRGAPWRGLETHHCGWWIDHGSEPLAACLAEAMSIGRQDLAAMGGRGREWMRRDYSWESKARMMSDVYRWFSGTLPRPDFVHQS